MWSAAAGVCATMAAINCLVWLRRPQSAANGIFAFMAACTAAMSLGELAMMEAPSPLAYSLILRWVHLPIFVLMIAVVGFVLVYLRAGRPWLAWTACAVRLVAVIANFLSPENVNFTHVTALRHVPFLGGEAAVAVGERNPWMVVSQLGLILLLAFLFDAGLEVWRRGERRKALVAGGAIFGFVFLGLAQAMISFWGFADVPITPSLFFVGIIAVMGLELSRDVLRAGELETELRERERRLALAAETASLGIWTREAQHGGVWASSHWRQIFGFRESEPITVESFLQRVHPEDRPLLREILWQPNRADRSYEVEYRINHPDGRLRWISSRGTYEIGKDGKAGSACGVSMDVTLRKEAELALANQRSELAHLSRVAMLGELSGSLAHELNQPLTAILSNAQAAQRFLAKPDFDRAEIEDILRDIVDADQRAGEVIRSLRTLFRKEEIQRVPLDVNAFVSDTLRLVHSDVINRNVFIETSFCEDSPSVRGDRVQLQQVLLNLVLNGADAMSATDKESRRLRVTTSISARSVKISVLDHGSGIPVELREKIFEPFFTTKPHGMGLGLSVCNSILAAHGG
ncbi:MAG TPA: ATP-binding protein [Chthoniobacterales bacterium]|nr:ATP-binding protein [Chthoniobacterales bacterium]